MALSHNENIELTRQLLEHCNRIERETGYNPKGIRPMLESKGADVTLRKLSSRKTSGLAKLHSLERPDLSIERFILDSKWAEIVDSTIITQCRKNTEDLR